MYVTFSVRVYCVSAQQIRSRVFVLKPSVGIFGFASLIPSFQFFYSLVCFSELQTQMFVKKESVDIL